MDEEQTDFRGRPPLPVRWKLLWAGSVAYAQARTVRLPGFQLLQAYEGVDQSNLHETGGASSHTLQAWEEAPVLATFLIHRAVMRDMRAHRLTRQAAFGPT